MRTAVEIEKDIQTLEKAWDIVAGRHTQSADNIAEVLSELKKELETSNKYWQHWSLGEKMFNKLYGLSGFKRPSTWGYPVSLVYEFDVLNEAEQIPFINAGLELKDVL